ncbi:MAG: HAD family phosphatase, partial [Phycisphaerales bacterium]
MKIEAVCFDMDGTLIRNTDSVRYLCMLNNNLEELEEVERRQDIGSISWIESDYLKAELIEDLELAAVKEEFENHIRLIENIGQVLKFLKKQRIFSVLLTAGPTQVANILGTEFGFDCVYGSEYEVKNGKFTGEITSHLGNEGKLSCVKAVCATNNISLDHCVAIGDSESDIAIFENCGRSIAVNYCDTLKGKASEYIKTDDLAD